MCVEGGRGGGGAVQPEQAIDIWWASFNLFAMMLFVLPPMSIAMLGNLALVIDSLSG